MYHLQHKSSWIHLETVFLSNPNSLAKLEIDLLGFSRIMAFTFLDEFIIPRFSTHLFLFYDGLRFLFVLLQPLSDHLNKAHLHTKNVFCCSLCPWY
uniref:Uncharacterized protein n=1 Tax=Lepeophtheirus salmonis TaxID=72036 RepID=A0A0K2T1B5_LEPSM